MTARLVSGSGAAALASAVAAELGTELTELRAQAPGFSRGVSELTTS